LKIIKPAKLLSSENLKIIIEGIKSGLANTCTLEKDKTNVPS
jgi:hypothetical protein